MTEGRHDDNILAKYTVSASLEIESRASGSPGLAKSRMDEDVAESAGFAIPYSKYSKPSVKEWGSLAATSRSNESKG